MGRFQTRSQTKPLSSALVIGSDAEALLSKAEGATEDTIEDYELKHEEPPKPAITSVPNWLYTERGLYAIVYTPIYTAT